ncbi:tyrosine-type recombinase/integrase [Kurthia sp. FSL E2-0154]|uniref:tyrosine-type recombinase/integrase n=1 Tax=Kurthia sp. FSL E2-0154 TaxID=2921358 RepID=UPI0030F5DB2E
MYCKIQIKQFDGLHNFYKSHGLDYITAHGLRHTHCSLLFEAGATIKEVQFRLGHKDVKTTLDVYANATKKAKAETIDKFTNFIHEPSID